MSVVFARPILRRSHEDITSQQERCARRAAWNLAKNVYKLKSADDATYYFPIEVGATPAPTSKVPEERELVIDSGASMHIVNKRD